MVKCLICNKNTEFLFSKQGEAINKNYKLFKCNNCNFIFVNPKPTENELGNYYNKEQGVLLNTEKNVIKKAKKFLKKINKPNTSSLLEIGSSYGFFLNFLKENNWNNIQGLEISEQTSKFASEKFDLNVKTGKLNQVNFNKKFDIIVMFDVLEHLRNPEKDIKSIYNLLNKDGTLVINTPNFNSLEVIFNGKYWEWFIPPAHLNYFSPKSITKFLQKNKFKILNIETYQGDARHFVYAFLLALAQKLGLFSLLKIKIKKKLEIKGKIQQTERNKWYKYQDLIEIVLLPIYLIFSPLILFAYKLKLGPSMMIFAKKN